MSINDFFRNIMDQVNTGAITTEEAVAMQEELADFISACRAAFMDVTLRDRAMKSKDMRWAVRTGAVSNSEELKKLLAITETDHHVHAKPRI